MCSLECLWRKRSECKTSLVVLNLEFVHNYCHVVGCIWTFDKWRGNNQNLRRTSIISLFGFPIGMNTCPVCSLYVNPVGNDDDKSAGWSEVFFGLEILGYWHCRKQFLNIFMNIDRHTSITAQSDFCLVRLLRINVKLLRGIMPITSFSLSIQMALHCPNVAIPGSRIHRDDVNRTSLNTHGETSTLFPDHRPLRIIGKTILQG